MRRLFVLLVAALLAPVAATAQTGPPPQRTGIALPPNVVPDEAYVTPDGRTALFRGTGENAHTIFRWTAAGMQTISLPGPVKRFWPFSDGTFVVDTEGSNRGVYRWTPAGGVVNLSARFPGSGFTGNEDYFFTHDGKRGLFQSIITIDNSEECNGDNECDFSYAIYTNIYEINEQFQFRSIQNGIYNQDIPHDKSASHNGSFFNINLTSYIIKRKSNYTPFILKSSADGLSDTSFKYLLEVFVVTEDGMPRSVGTEVRSLINSSRDGRILIGRDDRGELMAYRDGAWSRFTMPNLAHYEVSEDGLHETWYTGDGSTGTLFQKSRDGEPRTLVSLPPSLLNEMPLVSETGDLAIVGPGDAQVLWSRGRGAEPLHAHLPSRFRAQWLNGQALLALDSATPDSAYVLVFGAPVRVRDLARTGRPSTPLDSIAVTVGDAPAVTTDALGTFPLPPGLDPSLSTTFTLRDLRSNRSRIVGPLRPEDLRDTTLVFPLSLHRRLDLALTSLATTGVPDVPGLRTLANAFLRYDTTRAQSTRRRWESSFALRPSEYAPHDEHLARMTMSAENLDALHRSTRDLAAQTASVAVQTVTTILAAQEAVGQVRAQIANNADDVFGTSVGGILRGIAGTGLDALSTSLHGAYLLFSGSIEEALPDPWNTGWSWFGEAITKGIGGAIAGSGSEGGRLRSGGSAFLGTLIETVVEKTGGPVIDAIYIGQTQDDLDAAAHEAALGSGTGGMRDAFVASATRANDASVRIDQRAQASEALLNTAKGWADVGDVAMVVGKVPGAQIAATLGAAIRAVSAVGLVVDEVLNIKELHTAASKDSPSTQRLAFGQAAVTRPEREQAGPTLAAASAMAQSSAASRSLDDALDRYAAHLAALDAAVAASGDGIEQTDSLQRAEASVRGVLAVETARLRALASDTTAAGAAVRRVGAASGVLAGEQGRLFAGLLPYLIPSLANDPDGVNDGGPLDGPMTGIPDTVRARIGAVGRAVDSLRAVHAAALAATASRTAPPTVAVVAVEQAFEVAPGEHTVRVRIGNVGTATADGVAARLVADGDTTGATRPVLRVTSAAEQSVGTLAPGSVEEVAWTVTAADTSSVGRGSLGVYRVEVSSTTAEAVTRGGVSSMTVQSATGVSSEAEAVPVAAATLEGVGPNPSGGRVRVRYALSSSAEVEVGVYDMLGRAVHRMERGVEGSGRQEMWLDVSGVAVGAYAVRLVVDGRVVGTTRLVVLR